MKRKKILSFYKDFAKVVKVPEKIFKEIQDLNFRTYVGNQFKENEKLRNFYLKNGIKSISDLPKEVKDIKELPLMEKEVLNTLILQREKKDLYGVIHTAGTTSKPIPVPYSPLSVEKGWGELTIRALILMGILKINEKEEILFEKGMMITSYNEKKPDSMHSSHVNTLALMDIVGEEFLIDQWVTRPLPETLEKIVKDKVKWIATVPIIFKKLCELAEKKKVDLKNLGITHLWYGGTSFPQSFKEYVKPRFGHPEIFGIYPSTEHNLAGTTVSKDNGFIKTKNEDVYVLFNDKIIFEILDDKGNNVKKIGERGRLVVTVTFMDKIPLIRYELGDVVNFEGYCNNFLMISSIKRNKALLFSAIKFHSFEVEHLKELLEKKSGINLFLLQLVKLSETEPLFNIVTMEKIGEDEKKLLKEECLGLFYEKEEYIKILRDSDSIKEPGVKFFERGSWIVNTPLLKTKILIDKSKN